MTLAPTIATPPVVFTVPAIENAAGTWTLMLIALAASTLGARIRAATTAADAVRSVRRLRIVRNRLLDIEVALPDGTRRWDEAWRPRPEGTVSRGAAIRARPRATASNPEM